MATSATDRLQKLLGSANKPPASSPNDLAMANNHTSSDEQLKAQLVINKEISQSVKRDSNTSQLEPTLNPMSSSDDDEYVAAFRKKPTMKVLKPPRHGGSMIENNVATRDVHADSTTSHFCSLQLVAKFPYKYIDDTDGRVSRHFLAKTNSTTETGMCKQGVSACNEETESGATLLTSCFRYFIHPPHSLQARPILLLPYDQVKTLIDSISRTFQAELVVPPEPFTISFSNDGTPQPRFLGKATNRHQIENMEASIPPVMAIHGEPPLEAPPEVRQQFNAFRGKCAGIIGAIKKKKIPVKNKKSFDHLFPIHDGASQLRRAQRYLGVRPRVARLHAPDPAQSWEKQARFHEEQPRMCNHVSNSFDVSRKTEYSFENEPIIISIDVESYERAHNLITEVGLSTLDTLDLVDLPPGESGENWMKQIRSRHFRIKGREHLINREFCIGDPTSFQFGQSEFVTIQDASDVVDSCFEYPFSVDFKYDGKIREPLWTSSEEEQISIKDGKIENAITSSFEGVNIHGPTNSDHDSANRAVASKILKSSIEALPHGKSFDIGSPTTNSRATPRSNSVQKGPVNRNIILVGHGIGNDLDYLNLLGSKIFSPSESTHPSVTADTLSNERGRSRVLTSVIEALDTSAMYKIMKDEQQTRSLARTLADLGRDAWFLHNAGNDARYTLEAFVAMVIKARLESDLRQAESHEQKEEEHGGPSYESTTEDAKENGHRDEGRLLPETGTTTGPTFENLSELSLSTLPPDCCVRGVSNGVNTRGVFATSLPIVDTSNANSHTHNHNVL